MTRREGGAPGKGVNICLRWLSFSLEKSTVHHTRSTIHLDASSDLIMFLGVFVFLEKNPFFLNPPTASFQILRSYLFWEVSHQSSIEAPDLQTSTALALLPVPAPGLWFTTVVSKCGSSLAGHDVQLWAAPVVSEPWPSAFPSDSVLPWFSQQTGPSSAPHPCSAAQLWAAAHLPPAWAL